MRESTRKLFNAFMITLGILWFISIHNVAYAAEYHNIGDNNVGAIFEASGINYRILTPYTKYNLGTVEAVGLSRPLTGVALVDVVRDVNNDTEYVLVSIAKNAFKGCKSIRSISIYEETQLKSIPDGCFMGCSNLQYAILENTCLKKIGKNAFKGCNKLWKISFNTKKMRKNSFGKNAFKGVKKGVIIATPSEKTRKYIDYAIKSGAKSPRYARRYKGYILIE